MNAENWSMVRGDEFLSDYLSSALWTSEDENGGQLDSIYDVTAFTDEAVYKAKINCDNFRKASEWQLFGGEWGESDAEDAGHCFWLSHNGHGSGFFERDLPGAQLLQEAARRFQELTVVETLDGLELE